MKKLLAVCLVVILLLTGCNYTETWIEILNGDIVNTSFEVSYEIDEEWANYFIDNALERGGEEKKFERQEQLGYKRVTVNATLDYKKRVGQLEVIIFNTFNPDKTETIKFYVEGANLFIPTHLIADRRYYYWTEEDNKSVKEVIEGKEYIMFNMNETDGYEYVFQRMMMGNVLIPLREEQVDFEEIFWTKKGGELEQLLRFFKNLETGIQKEGEDYTLSMNFSEVINQSEQVVLYTIDTVEKEHKTFLDGYYAIDDEDFEELLQNKEEIKMDVQGGYDWIRSSIERYGLQRIFDMSTVKAKWKIFKGANQEVEIKLVVPVDIIKEYAIEGPENRPFTATAKYIQNINKDSVVTIQIPKEYASGSELNKVYEKMKNEYEEQYRLEQEERDNWYEMVENTQPLSYVWDKDVYYYSAKELSESFKEEISYKKGVLYLKRGNKSIEVKHKMVHDQAYIEEATLKQLGYTVERTYGGDDNYYNDSSTRYVAHSVNYFIVSKEDQMLRFEGIPVLQLTLGENYEVNRSQSDCKGLGWKVVYEGEQVLHRVADHELSFRYFGEEPGTYEVYLIKYGMDSYQPISNVIKYIIE